MVTVSRNKLHHDPSCSGVPWQATPSLAGSLKKSLWSSQMTTHFECQSTQRDFYKQSTPSCHLCSTLPQYPMGPGLAWPECWPSGQHPSLWSWSWDKDSCQKQHRGPRSRAGCHSLLEKPRFQDKQKPEGQKWSQGQGQRGKISERANQEPASQGQWEKTSLSGSKWSIWTGVSVWGLNRMGCHEGPMTDWPPWLLHIFFLRGYQEGNRVPYSQTPSEVRQPDLRMSLHHSQQPASL